MSSRSRNPRNNDDEPPRQRRPYAEDPVGGWTQQNSPYTVEGELEGLARFATGARRDPSRARRLLFMWAAALFLLPFVIGTVALVVRVLNAIF